MCLIELHRFYLILNSVNLCQTVSPDGSPLTSAPLHHHTGGAQRSGPAANHLSRWGTGSIRLISPTVWSVEAALAAPTITRLSITLPFPSTYTAERVSSWLRLAGDLRLSLAHAQDKDKELQLPVCEMATSIDLKNVNRPLQFQFAVVAPLFTTTTTTTTAGSTFAALTALRLHRARVDAGELDDLLLSRCPRLKRLFLEWIALRDDHVRN